MPPIAPASSPLATPAAPAAAASPAVVPIPAVQGPGPTSPLDGQAVATSGVVTGVQRSEKHPGAYVQDPAGDGDAATSDGIFVDLSQAPSAIEGLRVGDRVDLRGTVREQHGMTTLLADADGGLATAAEGARTSSVEPLELDIPRDGQARDEYLEAREGMVVATGAAVAVGPTDPFGSWWAAPRDAHGPRRMFTPPDEAGAIAVGTTLGVETELATGDSVTALRGPLGYRFGRFEVQQTSWLRGLERGPQPPRAWGDIDADGAIGEVDIAAIRDRAGSAAAGPTDPADLDASGTIDEADATLAAERAERVTGEPTFTAATLNAWNFFDDVDAPDPVQEPVVSGNEYRLKVQKLATTIRDDLRLPDVLALQEVENAAVLESLRGRPELAAARYEQVILPTTGSRSISPALLVRGDRVTVQGVRQLQGEDAQGAASVAAARQRVAASAGEAAAAAPEPEPDDDPAAPGKLFNREPLVADLQVQVDGRSEDLTVVVAHLVSQYTRGGIDAGDLRLRQAEFLRGEVERMRAERPGREVLLLGDLNDTPGSAPVRALVDARDGVVALRDLVSELAPAGEAYSYVYDGQSELLDHVHASPGLADRAEWVGVRHGNADRPPSLAGQPGGARASDHDAPYATFRLPDPAAGAADAAAGAARLSSAPGS